jgi:hypothetical protein
LVREGREFLMGERFGTSKNFRVSLVGGASEINVGFNGDKKGI